MSPQVKNSRKFLDEIKTRIDDAAVFTLVHSSGRGRPKHTFVREQRGEDLRLWPCPGYL